jgi:hypothetical protein
MNTLDKIGALVLVLALVSGLLLSLGTIKARDHRGQAIFVTGWTLVLVSALMIVQNY